MSTNTQTISRPLASLNVPTKVPALITYARAIVQALTGNTWIPSPLPTIAAITAAIADLVTSETATLARTKGAVTTRNEKKAALVALLRQLRGNVQAAADASPDNGGTIIESAGIALRKAQTRPARVFAATPSALTGSVKLVAPSAGRRAAYEWEYSTDGGSATWVAGAAVAPGEDGRARPEGGDDGAVPVPRRREGRRHELEPEGPPAGPVTG